MSSFNTWLQENNKVDFSKYPNFFKYCSNTLIDAYLAKKTIRFTQPIQLNDPLELTPIIRTGHDQEDTKFIVNGVKMPSAVEWYRLMLVESQKKYYGILSLTKDPQSFAMWNYYANGHKGFLIELKEDFNENEKFKSYNNEIYPIKEVNYFPIFEFNLLDIVDKKTNTFSIEDFNNILFYSKTTRWKYEKEYRLVRRLKDFQPEGEIDDKKLYLGELPFEVIKSVTFGACMSSKDKKNIINNISGTKIKIQQAAIFNDFVGEDGKTGKVSLLAGNKKTDIDTYVNNNIWTFEEKKFSNYYNKKEKEINTTIEKLPYYNGFESEVLDMYKFLRDKFLRNRNE